MTPKEKAEDICSRMALDSDYKEMRLVKKYALIAVDEIMKFPSQLMYDIVWMAHRETDINNWLDTESIVPIRMNALEYWNEVKNELEKL